MKKIIVVGSSNTDMVVRVSRLPVPGETILSGDFFMNQGGKGANQAVAVARLGGNVSFIAKVGNDIFGKQSLNEYQSEGINTQYIFLDDKNPSGVALISVDDAAENCIVVASGANAALSPEDIDIASMEMEPGGIVLVQLEISMETVKHVVDTAYNTGLTIILNPAPAAALDASLLEKLYMITPNETEAEILSGIKITDLESAQNAARRINEKGVKIVIITLGSKGALIYENGKFQLIEAPKVKAVDTTAAGDVFNGALCVALAESKNTTEAVQFAVRAASISVTRAGAQASAPFREEVSCK